MLKFQEESLRQSVNGALALRHQINPFLDAIFEKVLQTYVFWELAVHTHLPCRQFLI